MTSGALFGPVCMCESRLPFSSVSAALPSPPPTTVTASLQSTFARELAASFSLAYRLCTRQQRRTQRTKCECTPTTRGRFRKSADVFCPRTPAKGCCIHAGNPPRISFSGRHPKFVRPHILDSCLLCAQPRTRPTYPTHCLCNYDLHCYLYMAVFLPGVINTA